MCKLIFRWTAVTAALALLLTGCGCEGPPPDLSDANIIELLLGLIEGETRFTSEPFVITTPSDAIIPAPAPGAEFTVAVGSDEVTIVQAHSGAVEVYAAGEWRILEAGEQTKIEPGEPPSPPAALVPLDRESYLEQPALGGK